MIPFGTILHSLQTPSNLHNPTTSGSGYLSLKPYVNKDQRLKNVPDTHLE